LTPCLKTGVHQMQNMAFWKNTSRRYKISRSLHWIAFGTIISSAWYAYNNILLAPEDVEARQAAMTQHIDWSWVATGVVALRIAWRFYSRGPRDTKQVSPLIKANRVVNVMLRWLPLPITVTGVGVIWAAGRDVLAFGIPVMSGAAERSTDLQGTMEMAHSGLWYFLTALLVMHIIVALEQ